MFKTLFDQTPHYYSRLTMGLPADDHESRLVASVCIFDLVSGMSPRVRVCLPMARLGWSQVIVAMVRALHEKFPRMIPGPKQDHAAAAQLHVILNASDEQVIEVLPSSLGANLITSAQSFVLSFGMLSVATATSNCPMALSKKDANNTVDGSHAAELEFPGFSTRRESYLEADTEHVPLLSL